MADWFGAFTQTVGYNSGVTGSSSSTTSYILMGIFIAVCIAAIVYFVMGFFGTRPVTQGFYGGAINGTSELPCGRNSSESEALYAMFANKLMTTEEASGDLRDLKNLLSKLSCFKQDLLAPQQMIAASKELGFSTHMDIQPVADLTGRCFSKSVPERDLSVQFEKWRDYGLFLLRRLCTEANLSEAESKKAEELLLAAWKDVYGVAQSACINHIPKGEGAFKQSPHDPRPSVPAEVTDLRPYDGYY